MERQTDTQACVQWGVQAGIRDYFCELVLSWWVLKVNSDYWFCMANAFIHQAIP